MDDTLSKLPKTLTDRGYTLDVANKSIALCPKDDWKDRIQIELGDSKDPSTFQPQVKIMRWDNEVNLSFRLKDFADYTVATEGETIKLVNNTQEVHFYDLPIDEKNPEGAYEFEVILKEKPKTNKIEFTLNTKGAKFYYQPAVTEEIKVGDEDGKIVLVTETDAFDKDGNSTFHRPEDVVGSYAVYSLEEKLNYVGGKEYKSGKIGHIYRPKIIDSAGMETWGELSIDSVNGLLTIITPQKFLDKAIYPISIDPTFSTGYGAGSTNQGASNYLFGNPATAPADLGSITSISIRSKDSNTLYTLKGVITNSSLAIVTNGVSAGGTISGIGWQVRNFSSTPSVSASQSVYLWYISSNGCAVHCDSSAGAGKIDSTNSYTTPADGTGASTWNYIASIYATYTGSGTKPKVNIGDVWKQSTALQVNIGDVWKPVTKAQVNIGDTWKAIF